MILSLISKKFLDNFKPSLNWYIAESYLPVRTKYSALDLWRPIILPDKPCASASSYQTKGSSGFILDKFIKSSSALSGSPFKI